MKKILKTKEGFTLVETLVAIVILAIMGISILSMTSYNMRVNSTSRSHTMAIQLAEDALEKKFRENFDTLTSDSPEDYGTIKNFETFKRTVAVNSVDADNFNITVTVTWMKGGKESPPIQFSLLRTKQ